MTTKRIIKHLPLLLAGFAMGLGVFSYSFEKKPEQASAVIDINDYTACNTAYNDEDASGLLSALRTITSPGHSGDYDDLWTTYKKCYVRSDGKIFDYYSSITNYVPGGSAQGANYSKEGDSYNREHCIPKSWWGGSTSNQGADPYIVVPTDGYVNSIRSNYTFGFVGNATKTFSNTKLGSGLSSYGYTGTVFEPDDSVKGDFARIYFYAIAKYSGASGWRTGDGGKNFSGSDSTNYGLTDYAVKLFTKWHHDDPVSDWEISLNDKVSAIQGNRNPFIDHPEYANVLWGSLSGGTLYPVSSEPKVDLVSVSPAQLNLYLNGQKTSQLSVVVHVENGAAQTVTWSSSNTNVATVSNSGLVTAVGVGNTTITATSTVDNTKSGTCSVVVSSNAPTLSSISVDKAPNITTYIVGEYFDPTGLEITRYYSNSTSDIYTYANHTSEFSFSPSLSTALQKSNTSITIFYEGKSTTQAINVVESGGSGEAESFNNTYSYTDMTDWSVSNTGSASGYILCPNDNSSTSIVSIPGIFSGKTITSDVVITINSATYGSGSNPSTDTYKIYTSESCSTQMTAAQTGNLPSSTTYTNVIYTVTRANAIANFSNDLVILITKPGKQIRLKSIKVEFSFAEIQISSISASSLRTFYVGETISISDIDVEDNFGNTISDFDFKNDGYQFTYDDAASGGILTYKTFEDSISYDSFTCDITVQVLRKSRTDSAPSSDVLNLAFTGQSGSTYGSWGAKAAPTSSAYYAGHNAGGNSSIQLRSDATNNNTYSNIRSGIISTVSGGTLASVSVSWEGTTSAGRTLNIYGKNTAYSSTNDLYSNNSADKGTLLGTIVKGTSTSITISGSYTYIGICSASGAMYLSSVTISYSGSDSALNLANYIMFEDTNNQCNSKLNTAIGYLKSLSSTEKTAFSTSNDYVISTARTRLNAWAASQGKQVDYSTGNLTSASHFIGFGTQENNNIIIVLIIISMVGVSSIGACLYIRKKRSR